MKTAIDRIEEKLKKSKGQETFVVERRLLEHVVKCSREDKEKIKRLFAKKTTKVSE